MVKVHALAVLVYVVATFTVQATSHFLIGAEHYASIAFMRKAPIIPMGIAAMLIQGLAFSWLFSRMPQRTIADAVRFALVVGAVIVSYIALGEAGKYALPSIARWIAQEVGAGLAQFALYGVLLGLVYRSAPAHA